jgi:hypothetical protein
MFEFREAVNWPPYCGLPRESHQWAVDIVGLVVVTGLVTVVVEVVVVVATCVEVVVVASVDVVVVALEQDVSIKADTIKILKPIQMTFFFIFPPLFILPSRFREHCTSTGRYCQD